MEILLILVALAVLFVLMRLHAASIRDQEDARTDSLGEEHGEQESKESKQ